MYTLAELCFFVTQETSVQILKTYILPLLESGTYLIETKLLIERLQKTQNNALRICFKVPNTSPSLPLHCRSNLLSLDLRRKCSLLNYMNLKLIKNDSTFILDAWKDIRTRTSNELMKTVFPSCERIL